MHTLVFRSLKRTHDMFLSEEGVFPPLDSKAYVFTILTSSLNKPLKLNSIYAVKLLGKHRKPEPLTDPSSIWLRNNKNRLGRRDYPPVVEMKFWPLKIIWILIPPVSHWLSRPPFPLQKAFKPLKLRILQQSEFRAMPEDHPAAVLKVWPHGKLLRCPNPSGIPRGNSPALFPVTPAGSVAWP